MKYTSAIALIFIITFFSLSCFASELKVTKLEDSSMKREDGNVLVNLKAYVINKGNIPQVMLKVQAVDSSNHTMKNFVLEGVVHPGSAGELIGTIPVSDFEHKKIKKWIVE